MSRTHYTAADLERLSCNVKDVDTIITFRNEQLLNLWINEMSGQISDGMWENSNKTEWLWKNIIYRLGPETKVEVFSSYRIGRRSFPMVKELWDVIGDRLYGEHDETTAGYQTEKEVRAAWKELNLAIYNVKELPRDDEWRTKRTKADSEFRSMVGNLRKQAQEEREKVTGNNYGGVYLDPETRKTYMPIETVVWNETYYFRINKAFKVPAGKLAEGLEEIRELSKKFQNFEIVSVY